MIFCESMPIFIEKWVFKFIFESYFLYCKRSEVVKYFTLCQVRRILCHFQVCCDFPYKKLEQEIRVYFCRFLLQLQLVRSIQMSRNLFQEFQTRLARIMRGRNWTRLKISKKVNFIGSDSMRLVQIWDRMRKVFQAWDKFYFYFYAFNWLVNYWKLLLKFLWEPLKSNKTNNNDCQWNVISVTSYWRHIQWCDDLFKNLRKL